MASVFSHGKDFAVRERRDNIQLHYDILISVSREYIFLVGSCKSHFTYMKPVHKDLRKLAFGLTFELIQPTHVPSEFKT